MKIRNSLGQVLVTDAEYEILIANGLGAGNEEHDPLPVVKFFMPDGGATWLLSEIDPEYPDIAFGLCDLGMGFPELGSVSLSELLSVR